MAVADGRWIPESLNYQKHEEEPAFSHNTHLSEHFTISFFCPGKIAGFFH
jgi:hypothetical protein